MLDGTLTVGSLLVVIAYLAAVYNPLSSIAHTTGSLQQAVVSARRVREILALTPEPLDAPGGRRRRRRRRRHPLRARVSFAYDDRAILEDISFDARPGEMVALVGLTGAGKTTLASLLPRFFEPTAGRVLIDGVDVRDYDLRSLRERIALVPQEPVLFAGLDRRQHPLRPARRQPTTRSRRRPAPPTCTPSSSGCRTATTRSWPKPAPRSRAASASGWASPGRCSRTRRS